MQLSAPSGVSSRRPSGGGRHSAMAAAVAAAVRRRDEQRANNSQGGDDSDAVVRSITKSTVAPEDLLPPKVESGFWKYQRDAAQVYLSIRVQLTVAGLIGGNFLMNIIEKWVDPDGDQLADVWLGFDIFFNVSFTIELIWNMYSFWLCRFWKSAWNVFDVVVVSIGLLNYILPDLPGPLGLLRMMRAFRVFRLFKRVESLRKIMASLSKAVPGVANAFFIQVLVMSIYAILGVEFFMNYGENGSYTNELGEVVEITTARDLQYGYEYFGNFGKALFTMFQVLTGESWSEVVTRPMLHTTNPTQAIGVSFFFVSFNLVNGIVLINVAIAVLLEKMVDDEGHKEPMPKQEVDSTPVALDENKVYAFADEEYDKVAIAEDVTSKSSPSQGKTEVSTATHGEPARGGHDGYDGGLGALGAMETDFLSLRTDMAKIKLQMSELLTVLKERSRVPNGPYRSEESSMHVKSM